MNSLETKGTNTNIACRPNLLDALWARFTEPFLAGKATSSVASSVDEFGDLADLIPEGSQVMSFDSDYQTLTLIETDAWSAVVSRGSRGSGSITVISDRCETAEAALRTMLERLPPPSVEEGSVPMDFWQLAQRMFTTTRTIESPAWPEIVDHYPPEVGMAILDLMGAELGEVSGRVVLWHGPPGTGKTTAIRSLAGAWRDQARFQIVLDPEQVFSSSGHMMSIILGDDDDLGDRWRVLVIGDADSLVARDGNNGHILSRLLNVGDGIVGQGLRVILLLTANKPPGQLHPALSRPGRCLADTEFRPFNHREAVASFGPGVPNRAQHTLAELMNERNEPAAVSTGQYL